MKVFIALFVISIFNCHGQTKEVSEKSDSQFPIHKTEKEWKSKLTPMEYKVLRQKGTEYAFTGKYDDFFKKGDYHCAACGAILYKSANKYDAHCGWPSFDKGVEENLGYRIDHSHNMVRTEVYCKRCGGHLGHIFNDGPEQTTGKRHCINSVSLQFIASKEGDTKSSAQ